MAAGKAGVRFMCVDTTQEFYDRNSADHPRIHYLGINACDRPGYAMCPYFELCAEWIRAALEQNSGERVRVHTFMPVPTDNKVLVHCLMGFSRSPTIVAAYLMLHQSGNRGRFFKINRSFTDMSAAQAMHQIASKRYIHPNAGFIRQLAEYDAKLTARQDANQTRR
jgi:hypothetical protein